jgi:A/G-specific adenine glycosylase
MPYTHAPIFTKKIVFRRALMTWYREQARDLSWRGTLDPYAIWVSEIVLQQTRVDQGTPYIERFLKKFPTVFDLAKANEDAVLKLWEGLGYYSRARNLHKAARLVANEREGIFPATALEWETLPGVGRYTAGAIASIAYGENAPVVDGNVKRVLARLLDCHDNVDSPATTNAIWDWMTILVRGKNPGEFNQSVMELGASICSPRNPNCGCCPVKRFCLAHSQSTQAQLPVRTPKKKVPHHQIVVAAIKKNGRYLLGKRPADGMLGGLWEFPGGKVEPREAHETALHREINEELGVGIDIVESLGSIEHAYSHFKITLHVYLCKHTHGTLVAHAHTELKWVSKKNFSTYTFPKANHKFLSTLP